MAPLSNKLVAVVAFKTTGDLFHQIMLTTPHHTAQASPEKIFNCHLHEGSYGTNGSIVEWEYFLDGEVRKTKAIQEEIEEGKRHIGWKIIEGNLTELYRDVYVSTDVETKEGVDFISWTIEYELLKPENPHPLSLINFWIEFTKDVEAHVTKE